ncbi:hypothetical protein BH10BDE1_BH10BDE1_08860 [soil metagenome]
MHLRSNAATLAATVLVSILTTATAFAGSVHPLVIYGNDDRLEVYEEKDAAKQILSESVVAIMSSDVVATNKDGSFTLGGGNYGKDNQLCSTEKFTEQSAPAYCSGFLVADNIIATAGHCVTEAGFCKDAKFVFGFAIDKKGRDPQAVGADDVYGCKAVRHQLQENNGSDFALVELDRPVVGRKALNFAKRAPAAGDDVFVIGHPVGLPAKIAGGAQVRNDDKGFFVANLDTFGGNSGSAVFNSKYEVAGVLVRGENDFVRKGSCYISNKCKDSMCRGEDVTNPDVVSLALDDVLKAPPVATPVTPAPPAAKPPHAPHRP